MRALATILAAALGMVQNGCGRKDARPRPDVVTPTSPASAHNDAGAARTGDRVMPILPRHEGTRVVFSGARVGWLTADRAVLVAPDAPDAATSIPLGSARGIAATPAGFVIIGGQGSHTVHRVGDGAAESWPASLRLTGDIVHVFPGGEGFWVSARDGLQPVELRIAGTRLATGARIELSPQPAPGHQYDVARLGDGRFVRLMGELFLIDPPNPERKLVELPASVTSAVLVAANGQRIWLARPGELVAIAPKPPAVVARAGLPSLGHRVHALAASSDHVAAIVRVQASLGSNPAWTVAAFDATGKSAFSQQLPWQPELNDTHDVSVAISSAPARIAAASAERLVVWELATGKTLLDRAP